MSPPLISKAAARYTGAGGKEHCSLCRHFSPRRGGRCARVLGDISPRGWCRLFSREMRGLVADASSFNGGGGPSLGLDFMMPGVLDPRITFTRASTATYFNSAGVMQTAAVNAPRWDYDPATLALRGLLIEEARTNVVLNSATLSTQSVTVTAQAYTLSFYGTGTITKSGTATGALVGTGVGQRVSQTFTPTAGSLTLTVTGSVTNAQLEAGAFATSYIPTTSAAVTRAVDVATMPLAGWFNAPAGTLVTDANIPALSGGTFTFVTIDDATTANRIIYRTTNTATAALYLVASATTATAALGSIAAGVNFKAGAAMLPGSVYGTVNGGSIVTANGAQPAGLTTMRIGNSLAVNQSLNGYFQRIRYWSRALSNAELQSVTT
jgi:hypothetical protein